MKPAYLGLAAIALVAGAWAIVSSVSHPTLTPEDAVTIAHEPEVERAPPPKAESEPVVVAPAVLDPEVEQAARSETPVEPAAQGGTPELIGSLRSRKHTIYLYAGRFTIEDSDGQTLANLVSEREFAKLLPELFGEFKQMYAEGRLSADNRTHGKIPTGWSYSFAPTTVQNVKITSDP